MAIGYRKLGKWIWDGTKAAISANCCCCPCSWFEMPADTEDFGSWEVRKGGGSFVPATDTVELTFNGAWCPGVDWISTVADNDLNNNDIGLDEDLGIVYTYRVKFDILDARAVDCLRILGLYSADNYCNAMRVNGNTVPAKPDTPSYCQYGSTTNWQFDYYDNDHNPKSDFVIEAASGWWVMGENTLEWDVINDSNEPLVELSPTGIWVAFYQCIDNSIDNPDC